MFYFINTSELSTVKGNRALNLYFYSSLYVHEYITISKKVLFFSLKNGFQMPVIKVCYHKVCYFMLSQKMQGIQINLRALKLK